MLVRFLNKENHKYFILELMRQSSKGLAPERKAKAIGRN